MSRIELKHIDKFYGSNHVLRDINLTIEDGDFMTLLGPSGCGKTTTLRVVSGLEKPQNGIMTIDGVEMINADDAYYADAVVWAVAKSITSGATATTFDPDGKITREQIAAILYRYAGSPAASSSALSWLWVVVAG